MAWVVVLVLVIVAVGLLVTVHTRLTERRVVAILQRGGPRTLQEYQFLFPGACPKCGSRRFFRMRYSDSFPSSDNFLQVNEGYYVKCARCDQCDPHHPGSFTENSYFESVVEDLEIGSPYLTRVQIISIPDDHTAFS